MTESLVSHHIIAYLDNTSDHKIGFIVSPSTYRVRHAPSFLPKWSVGDPRGIDETRWKTFVQHSFEGGAGQLRWNGASGNNRFAKSHLIELGVPLSELAGTDADQARRVEAGIGGRGLDDSPLGDAQGGLIPVNTSAAFNMLQNITTTARMSVLEMSYRPHVYAGHIHAQYNSLSGPDVWALGLSAGTTDALTGIWNLEHSMLPIVRDAVEFSDVHVLAISEPVEVSAGLTYSGGMLIYGPYFQSGLTNTNMAATTYIPAYATEAEHLAVYDHRIWRTVGGGAAAFNPKENVWSDITRVADSGAAVHNMKAAFGRLYFGCRDSLNVFEAGVTYMVEDFSDRADPHNFLLMAELRGALYFNIRHRMFRLTGGGTIELLDIPPLGGPVVGGTATDEELIIIAQDIGESSYVWIFDPETGGTRKWFDGDRVLAPVSRHPKDVVSKMGYVWTGVTSFSTNFDEASYAMVSGNPSGIAAVNRFDAAVGGNPSYANAHMDLFTSLLSLGYDTLDKQIDRVIVNYHLPSAGDRIDVLYRNDLQLPALCHTLEVRYVNGIDRTVHDQTGMRDYDVETNAFTYSVNNPLQANDTEWLILGFNYKPQRFKVLCDSAGDDFDSAILTDDVEIWNGSDWEDVQHFKKAEGTFNDGETVYEITGGPNWYPLHMSVNGDPTNTVYGPTWFARLKTDEAGGSQPAVREIVPLQVHDLPFERMEGWQTLGSITDASKRRQSFDLPERYVAREIMLWFRYWGSHYSVPAVERFDIKYAPIATPLEIHSFTVIADDFIEPINLGPVEQSGEAITAVLMSLSKSGLTHVWEVPYPTVHTLRARATVLDPGAGVPTFQPTDNSEFLGSLIPIQLDEM